VIANHFKSKGSGTNDGTGQGNANPDRIAQAEALAVYADDLAVERGVEAVFLTGDFNAYSMEDPMQALDDEGYENVAPDNQWSYNFDGQVGSLDHVLANEAAAVQVTGVDIWEINSNETVFQQYSRYNYNAALLYQPGPFSASDHNPEIVGIGEPVELAPSTVTGTDVSVDYGQGTTMHVTVEADGEVPAGTVTLKVGDVVLGTGTLVDGSTEAKINRNRVDPGVHTVTIEYSGDASVAPGQGTATLTVDKATPTVVGTRTVVEYGSATTMAVRVGATGVVPTGQVVLKVGDVRLGSGTLTDGVTAATIGARKLEPGTYVVTIRYDGDEFVAPGTGTATLVVKKATSTVVAPNTSMTFGETGSLLVKVKAIGVVPTGTVRVFSAEGLALSAATTLVNGEASVTLTANKLPASPTPYTVTIKYSGDELVQPGTDTSTLRVKN
jgi:5'-nucleotidase